MTSFARDGGDVEGENPRDLMPVITLENPSPRLKDFWIATDRCTSRPMGIVDTVPHARPQQAHSNGHWVDHLSYPDSIQFFLDAANIHETIMAHEIAHVWIDIVEGCEDYRVLRDLTDPSRYRQVQHIQSFVLDRKVHEVLRKRGFDLTIIEEHQREALLSLSRAVIAGYVPPYAREAATIAMLIAATRLEQEQGLHNVPVLSLVLAYDGTLGSALRLLKQELPEIYALAEYLADSVRHHGYSNREGIYRAVDDCLLAAFDFTGDPLRLDEDLEEKPCGDSYQEDKWPGFFPGWSVQAKVEAGKAMAKYGIGGEVIWNVSYTLGGTLQMAFQKDSGDWTPPIPLPHAPSRLPERMMPQPRPHFAPSAFPTHPPMRRPVVPQPQMAMPPMPHVPQVLMPQAPRPHVGPKFSTPRSTPSHIPPLPSPFDKPRPYGRDYMPGLGLWLSRARLKEQMELREHPYGYAFNNPVNYIDPSGLAPVSHQIGPFRPNGPYVTPDMHTPRPPGGARVPAIPRSSTPSPLALPPIGLAYGNCCGPFLRCNSCSRVIDAIDAACRKHDQCLATWREFFSPSRQERCNLQLCYDAVEAYLRGCKRARGASNPRRCRQAAFQIATVFCQGISNLEDLK